MEIDASERERLGAVAKEVLDTVASIAGAAEAWLADGKQIGVAALAAPNTFNDTRTLNTLGAVDQERRESCERLIREPAVARVVTIAEDGSRQTFYISSVASLQSRIGDARLASYKSPAGRLAVLPVGDGLELRTPGGVQFLEVVEAAALDPRRGGAEWDAIDTRFRSEGLGARSVTVDSLLRFLSGEMLDEDDADALDRLLAEEAAGDAIRDAGRRRTVEKASLRDTRLLDLYQDAIFRLPIDSRLAIMGPPGTGKTTTLIVRLGQKIRAEYLEPREQALIDGLSRATAHSLSWLMFTPTDLLKQYVRSAFGRHQIPAPEDRIVTWESERLRLARNVFGILRTRSGTGFVMPPEAATLLPSTLTDQRSWCEDFEAWQSAAFWSDLAAVADRLASNPDQAVSSLGSRFAALIARAEGPPSPSTLLAIASLEPEARALLDRLRTETDQRVRRALTLQVNASRTFLDEFARFIDSLSDVQPPQPGDEEDDELDDEDEDEPVGTRTGRAAAMAAYGRTIRTQARGRARGRRTLAARTARIVEWLEGRGLDDEALIALGRSLLLQADVRRIISPARAFFRGVTRRYRAFRRERRAEGRWYTDARQVVHRAEVDLLLHAILQPSRELLADDRVRSALGTQPFSWLTAVEAEFRNQIMIDEATDFSPTQLGCMAALADPALDSLFLCGDFNQRLTTWGIRDEDDLGWGAPTVEIQNVAIAYRQSRQLHDLSVALLEATGGRVGPSELPPDIETGGVDPVLGYGMMDDAAVVGWLDERLMEIEELSGGRGLPSIAVLVNDEARVGPLAAQLDRLIAGRNLKAVACVEGRMLGEQSEVRVFDIQHIKGLEFEAVFFIDVDGLQADQPELFDRYLYVGATRAATYLGLTCRGDNLPAKIATLESRFGRDWR